MSTQSSPPQPYAQEVDFLGVRARVLTDPGQDASVGVVEMRIPAGDMPPLHVHPAHDEGFHVLDGELTLFLPGHEVTLRAGDFLLAPKGVPHAYLAGEAGAHCLVLCTPSGFERFVLAVAALDAPTPEVLGPLAAAHDVELLGPPGARP